MPPVELVTHATHSADERSEGPKAKAQRTRKENGSDKGIASPQAEESVKRAESTTPGTLGDSEWVERENKRVPSPDISTLLDQDSKEQPVAKKMTEAKEGPPKCAGCMPSKDSFAQRQQTIKLPSSTRHAKMEKVAEVGTIPEGLRHPRGLNGIQWKNCSISYL